MDRDLGKLDLLGLMPCPLRLPFQELTERKARELEAKTGRRIRFASYGMMYKKPVKDLFSRTEIGQWPSAVLFFGLGPFFTPRFQKLFIEKGYFEAIVTDHNNPLMEKLGMYDPWGCYDMLGFSPYHFLVDKTQRPDLPSPRGWLDLAREEYGRTVAVKGEEGQPLCDMSLLSMYRFGGEEAVRGFGRAVKGRIACAEMVRIAGSRRVEAAPISILPYTFAKSARVGDKLQFVCPEEGAACLPLMCLTKKDADEHVKEFVRSLARPDTAFSYHKAGFITASDPKDVCFDHNYYWFGWDLLHGEVGAHIKSLDAIAKSTYSSSAAGKTKETEICSC